VLELFSIPASDYKRFMNFLSTHDCRADYREFRTAKGDVPRAPRTILPLLPPLAPPSITDPARRDNLDDETARERTAS
jgi:hypothetical protein